MTISTETQFTLRFIDSITEIESHRWNTLAGKDYPFMRYEFLLALEESNCASAASGWQPFHALVEKTSPKKSGEQEPILAALMPMFLKSNSYGEYVFDWAWADAYQQYGLPYYPKLVAAIPFTPSAGTRICLNPDYATEDILTFIAQQIPHQAGTLNISGWHVLFPEAELSKQLHEHGVQQRLGCQYQWFNQSFQSFDHFLEKFTSRKRKNIKKERSKIVASDIHFEIIEGRDITPTHWQKFYQFYQSTYFVRGRQPYLNQQFFEKIGASMPENLLLVMAVKGNEYIAGALSFKGKDTLYGRYWGCSEEYQFLHFETCYYQGIEYCIAHKLKRFDSGAQGEHKIQRGFEPVVTYSNHWLARPEFNNAISTFLDEEKTYIHQHIDRASELLPFKQTTL